MTLLPGPALAARWLPQARHARRAGRARSASTRRASRQTVQRFNGFAVEGVDPDFRRGESRTITSTAIPTTSRTPTWAPSRSRRSTRSRSSPAAIGTKGGPRVNVDAQVLRVDGAPIPGLYAAGNVMAGVTGPGYPGAGSTIGDGDDVRLPRRRATRRPRRRARETPCPRSRTPPTMRPAARAPSGTFVSDMNNWAPFLTGYQKHEIIDDTDSIWTLKGEVGMLEPHRRAAGARHGVGRAGEASPSR